MSTLIRLAKEAGKRYELRPLLKEMVRYSNVQGIIRDDKNREKHAVRFYEAVKSVKWLNHAPHFWFQYAVASLAINSIEASERYFTVAYAKAKAMPGYFTNMIDNHYARLLLVKASSSKWSSTFFELYTEAKKILDRQAGNFSEKHYPFRVAAGLEHLMEVHAARMSAPQKSDILAFCQKIVDAAESMPRGLRDHPSVRDCVVRLNRVLVKEQ